MSSPRLMSLPRLISSPKSISITLSVPPLLEYNLPVSSTAIAPAARSTKVVIIPAGSIWRIRPFPASLTYTFPYPPAASLIGYSNLASIAGPSSPLRPRSPVPAKVVTTPAGSILRIVLRVESTAYTLPAESTTMSSSACGVEVREVTVPVESRRKTPPGSPTLAT